MATACGECSKRYNVFLASCNMCRKTFKKGSMYVCFDCRDTLIFDKNAYGYYCSDKCLQEFNEHGSTFIISTDDEDRKKLSRELEEHCTNYYESMSDEERAKLFKEQSEYLK